MAARAGAAAEAALSGSPDQAPLRYAPPPFSLVQAALAPNHDRLAISAIPAGCGASRISPPGGVSSTSTSRRRPHLRPALYVHGGSWSNGDKRRSRRPLIHHLAETGWVAVVPNYPLSPKATFPEHLIALENALAWMKPRS